MCDWVLIDNHKLPLLVLSPGRSLKQIVFEAIYFKSNISSMMFYGMDLAEGRSIRLYAASFAFSVKL